MAGTKRKTGQDRWRLEYMFEGERYSQYVSASSSSEADRKLALFVAEIEKGQYSRQSSVTFVEFAQTFLDEYAEGNLSPSTVTDYKSRLNRYVLKEFGLMKLNKIKRPHIQKFANKLVKEYNLSTKSANNYIKLMSSILNKAVQWDYLQNNVADKVDAPNNFEKSKKEVVLYSYDETRLFLQALEECEDEELKMAIYSSFVTGGRRGEILAINTSNINFEKSYIEIKDAKVKAKGGVIIKDTKNKKPRRVYVPKTYMNLLKDYVVDFLGNPSTDTDLFTMHPDTYTKKFKKFLTDNKLREIDLKDLRALNESILVNRGIDIVSAAKRLGHLPSTATNYYLDEIPEEDKKASKILEDLF